MCRRTKREPASGCQGLWIRRKVKRLIIKEWIVKCTPRSLNDLIVPFVVPQNSGTGSHLNVADVDGALCGLVAEALRCRNIRIPAKTFSA